MLWRFKAKKYSWARCKQTCLLHFKRKYLEFYTMSICLFECIGVVEAHDLLEFFGLYANTLTSKGLDYVFCNHRNFGQVHVTRDLHVLGWNSNWMCRRGISFICTKIHDIWKCESKVMASNVTFFRRWVVQMRALLCPPLTYKWAQPRSFKFEHSLVCKGA